jgi:endoglucanase
MHSIRHHPASVGTQIRQFGRGATGHGSDQDAAHSGGSGAVNTAIGPNYKYYWSSAASPSFTGLAAGTYAMTPDPNIPVYLNGKLTYGQTPSTTADEGCAPGGSGGSGGGGGTPSVTAEYETARRQPRSPRSATRSNWSTTAPVRSHCPH